MSRAETVQEIKLRLKERRVRHTLHALREEMRDGLTANYIDESLLNGFELVENYPNDPEGTVVYC